MIKLSLILISFSLLIGAGSCDRRLPGPEIKIYVLKPGMGGIYRAQEDELILFENSENYRVISPKDFDSLLNWCLNPSEQANSFREQSEKKRKNLISNINTYYIDQESR